MKFFTVDEANDLIPSLRPKLSAIRALYAKQVSLRDSAKAAAAVSNLGGGMQGGTEYVKVLYEIGKLTTEIHATGIELKDYSRGLIDFPCLRNGRPILLCWQLDDSDEVEWWHEPEAGFAGRQRL